MTDEDRIKTICDVTWAQGSDHYHCLKLLGRAVEEMTNRHIKYIKETREYEKNKDKQYYVVFANYVDDWENQRLNPEDKTFYTIANDSPAIEVKGYAEYAIYEDKNIALQREGQILDHATFVEKLTLKEVYEHGIK